MNFDNCRVLDQKFEPTNLNRSHFAVSKEVIDLTARLYLWRKYKKAGFIPTDFFFFLSLTILLGFLFVFLFLLFLVFNFLFVSCWRPLNRRWMVYNHGKTKIYTPNDFVFTSFVLLLSYLSEKLMNENALRDQLKSPHQQHISCLRKTDSFLSLTASSCHLRRRLVNFYGTYWQRRDK